MTVLLNCAIFRQKLYLACAHKENIFRSAVKCMSAVAADKSEVGQCGHLDLQEMCRTGNVPEKFNFARDVFDWHVSQRPSDTALWFCNEKNEDRIWTFAQVKTESLRAGLVLENLVGDHSSPSRHPFVLTILSRIPEWWFLHMGAIRGGVIFCPGTTMLTQEDIRYRLEASAAHMIITDEENAEKVEKAQQQWLKTGSSASKKLKKLLIAKSPDSKNGDWINYTSLTNKISDADTGKFRQADTKSADIAQAFFTSGTTGSPKMVAHHHSSYGVGHVETARQLGLKPGDVFWNLSDPGWAKSSYSNFYTPWIAGCTVFIHQMRFEAKPVLEVLRNKPVTVLCAPPTLYRTMVPEPSHSFKFKALRYAVGAGEAVNPEVVRAWGERTNGNIPLGQMYGQTEFTILGCEPPGEKQVGSLGKPNGMYTVQIVDESGKELPRNEEGVLALKVKPKYPVGLTKGYLKLGPDGPTWDEEKNAQCFIGDVYLTGDKCCMDEDGYIYFVGRADDIINSAGYRIGPNEVESVLQTHPAIIESAAVPSPDEERGEVVKAFIVLKDAYKSVDKSKLTTEIQDHVKQLTAPYKYPRKIEFVDSLPKTVSGKILRRELKRQEFAKK